MVNKKIKIYHLITSFWANHGPSNGILAQIRSQDPGEFDSAIWSLYAPPPALDPRALLHQAGLGYRVFPMGSSFLDARVLWPLVRQLRREPPDILHCHLLRANLYGRIAARLAGVRQVISTIHGVSEYFAGADPLSLSVRLVERLTAGWVAQYVTVSENSRRAVIRHLKIPPGKVCTIMNALDLGPFAQPRPDRRTIRAELGLAPEAVVIGSVGRLAPLKNFAALVEWAGELMALTPQVQLVIVGDGEERQALEGLIREMNLAARVKLPGFRADIPRVLSAMDIFAFPSLSEGLSIALLEAMAAALPCVVTDVGGNGEAVVAGDTGYVVSPDDARGFKEALISLAKDGKLREKLGTAGKTRAFTLFNPKRLAGEYRELYRSVLNRTLNR